MAQGKNKVFVLGVAVMACAGFVVSSVFAASPTKSDPTTMGTNATRDRMQSVMGGVLPPAIPPEQLPDPESEGARVLKRYCIQCHGLPSPGLHAPAEWPAIVNRMQDRILRLSDHERATIKVVALNTEEITAVLRYLKRYGFQTIDITRYPDIDTDIGKAFQQVCSQCHALPDPAIHPATQWKDIVLRMRRNMELLGMADPGDDALAKAMSFLQTYGRVEEK